MCSTIGIPAAGAPAAVRNSGQPVWGGEKRRNPRWRWASKGNRQAIFCGGNRVLRECLETRALGDILTSPYHPHTNGRTKRYHRSAKERVDRLVWESPDILREGIGQFLVAGNSRRYHAALGNVTPGNVCFRRLESIPARRGRLKQWTLENRKRSNLRRR